jgi:serine/threonine-protein kinase
MTYCQECGSEVAENDIFCPYCGISLKPIAEAGVSAVDEFASTVAMPELAVKRPNENAVPAGSEPTMPVEGDSSPPLLSEKEVAAASSDEKDTEEYPVFHLNDGSKDETETDNGPNIVAAEESHIDPIVTPNDPSPIEEKEKREQLVPKPDLAADAINTGHEVEGEAGTAEEAVAEEPAPVDLAPNVDQVVVEEIDLHAEPERDDLTGKAIGALSENPGPNAADIAIEQPKGEAPQDQDHEGIDTVLSDSPSKNASIEDDNSHEIEPSYTKPNIGSEGTDGRRTGLKPLAEGVMLAGRYKISKKIGGGGMGAVYLATDLNLGDTQRAVKEMVQSHIEEEQQAKAIEDFKRESMILTSLDHPSIPTIYDYFYDEVESRFYLVMKYISGGDLASRLRAAPEGRIDEQTVTEWAVQIIDVLDYLHTLPTTIVYRDLKPSNVMIDGKSGRIMLIDFGIARSINQTQEKGVTAVGTMGYAPPELFSGQVEPRSDIYSLGSTMFHLMTGADPQNNPLLIFDFQKNPRPRQINPRLSDQIEKILMRAVEYNADARFSTAAEMKLVLQDHLERLRAGKVTHGVSESPAAVSLAFQAVFCGFCGQRIVATDLFCAFCGSKQPIAQHGVHSEIYSRTAVTARLVIDGTSELDVPAYALEKNENLVGRRDPMSNIFPEVDLSKYDPQTKISRRHARIWRDGREFMVEDLGSSNGTLLLTQASEALRLLPHRPHSLANGDRIRIGDTTLQFIIG